MFIVALFTTAKTWNQPKCPLMTDWTRKMWHIYTMEYYAAMKKNKIMSFAGTWLALEAIILSKLTQKQKPRYYMFSLMWELKDENTWTHRGEQHTLGPIRGWRVRGEKVTNEH